MLLAVVLGSAAGGGFPQWNSNAPACRRARQGERWHKAAHSGIACCFGEQQDWFVLNASPDCGLQIEATEVCTRAQDCARRRLPEWCLRAVTSMDLPVC